MRFQGIGNASLARKVVLSIILIGYLFPLWGQVTSMIPGRDTTLSQIKNPTDTTATGKGVLQKANSTSDLLGVSAIRTLKGDSLLKDKLKKQLPDSTQLSSLLNPFASYKKATFRLRATDGYTSYQFAYRSNSDTPFVEKNIYQHNVQARLNLVVADILPFSVSYWGRWTNSSIYKDINDVQLSFNALSFAQSLQNTLKNQLLGLAPSLKDSLTGQLLALKKLKLEEMDKWLNSAATLEKRVEVNEILRIPRITYDPYLSEETNARREDSIKKVAALFMDVYNKTSALYYRVKSEVDSLHQVYEKSLVILRRFQDLVNGQGMDMTGKSWQRQMREYGMEEVTIPAKYKWLLGVKRFAVGRSPVDMSELTAKNISINGLNFEYNSWYYMALTAGIINYGFRDFAFSSHKTAPQYLIMGRIGLGQLRGNHLIFSLYEGRKHLFMAGSGINGRSTMHVIGYSIEGRYQLHKTTYLTAELAESSSPDFRNTPAQRPNKLGLSDKANSAYALHLYSYLPKMNLRVEGLYKYTGANFQSFSGFQSNASQKAWYVKADQSFFNRQLRMAVSIRSTDFSNPFVVQQYNSNTIFKSFMATFRRKRWPLLTVGYLPMTQLTKVGNQLLESRFQTFNASYYHIYKVKKSRAATTFVFNRFYNTQTDSGFVYYNASNWYAGQFFYFKMFSVGTTASLIRNSTYRLLVVEQNLQWNLPKWGTLGFGVKINRYNEKLIKMGGGCNGSMRVGKTDLLSFSVEKGYLPGYNGGLLANDFMSIQYMKSFSFHKS